jgi:hypothetical protein
MAGADIEPEKRLERKGERMGQPIAMGRESLLGSVLVGMNSRGRAGRDSCLGRCEKGFSHQRPFVRKMLGWT